MLAVGIAIVLLAGGTFTQWRAKNEEALLARNVLTPVRNVSTMTARDLAGIPPEAFHPQPTLLTGYNAHSGGLPRGALPPGVFLQGMPMMQGERTGYGPYDGIRQQFTQKERDNETRLDYFGARYCASAQGRFTSADAPFMDQHEHNPQS